MLKVFCKALSVVACWPIILVKRGHPETINIWMWNTNAASAWAKPRLRFTSSESREDQQRKASWVVETYLKHSEAISRSFKICVWNWLTASLATTVDRTAIQAHPSFPTQHSLTKRAVQWVLLIEIFYDLVSRMPVAGSLLTSHY